MTVCLVKVCLVKLFNMFKLVKSGLAVSGGKGWVTIRSDVSFVKRSLCLVFNLTGNLIVVL